MPMLDAFIPEGALSKEAEEKLIATLTDLLLKHEGADPKNETARSIAWVFVHRPQVYVAGAPATAPRYRFIPSVPEGQYDDERRAAMVAAVTEAVLDAEDGAHDRDPGRVWVFPNDIRDGRWGALGRIVTLQDIATFVTGDPEFARAHAEERIALARGGAVTA
jgi:phenylpyruvate tautomerase PptA (4-oxalocrotonate tautomerase family)